MKIALIRKRFTPFGGAEIFLNQLINLLLKQGHEVHLFANRWDNIPGENTGLVFHPVSQWKGFSFVKVLSFAFFVTRLLKREKFDIIHSFERIPYMDIYRAGDGLHKAWLHHRSRLKNPLLRLSAYLNPLHLSILYIERQIFSPNPERIILCNSEMVKKEIQRFYKLPEKEIRVLYNGVDLNGYQPGLRGQYGDKMREKYGLKKDDLVILFVGSGFERKGLPVLLRSIPLLKDRLKVGIKVLIIGKGRTPLYEKQVKQLGCQENVLFLGPIKDPAPWYGVGDIFVLPTLYDPFSNATLEALASGIPVITTRLNGASEIIQGKKCGVVLDDPLDFKALAKGIVHLQALGTHCDLSKIARDVAISYPMDQYVQQVLLLYQEKINNKSDTFLI